MNKWSRFSDLLFQVEESSALPCLVSHTSIHNKSLNKSRSTSAHQCGYQTTAPFYIQIEARLLDHLGFDSGSLSSFSSSEHEDEGEDKEQQSSCYVELGKPAAAESNNNLGDKSPPAVEVEMREWAEN